MFAVSVRRHFKVDPRNVYAYIIGEHGYSEVPAWSLTSVAGARLEDYSAVYGPELDDLYLNTIFEQVMNAAYKIIELKGRTYYAIGLGLTRIVESIIRDENAILTVSFPTPRLLWSGRHLSQLSNKFACTDTPYRMRVACSPHHE